MKKSAEQEIIDFLKANPSKWAAAELQRMAFHNKNGTLANPKAISRRLQENAEEGGMLEVSYDENGNAMYNIKEGFEKKKFVAYIRHPLTGVMYTIEDYANL